MDLKKPSETAKKIVPAVLAGVLLFTGGMLAGRQVLPPASADGSDKISKIQNLLENNWYFGKDKENLDTELVDKALHGMVNFEEDPHTSYLDQETAKAFTTSLSGSNVGVGFQFFKNRDGQVTVSQVFLDSPAEKGGLKTGDVITKIDGFDTAAKENDEIVSYIKSKDSKEVTLEVSRNGQTETLKVVPGSYDLTVSASTDGNTGLIALNRFAENSGKHFNQAVKKIKDSGAKNLILDLRDNTGGYVKAAQEVASSLLPADSVVFVEKMADGSVNEFKTSRQFSQTEFDNIIILQNQNTASASEILIGALKDLLPEGTVTTVGTNTYGKGTEQTAVPFEDGTSLKYTIAEWVTPNGTSINQVGFAPDVEVPDPDVITASYMVFDEGTVIEPDTVHANAAPVQIFLDYLGYPVERKDTYFAPSSSEALKTFQSEHGLEATGSVDKATFDALVSEVGFKLNEDRISMDTQYQKAKSLLEGK